MTMKDLKTGDIIVNRGGYLGVIILEKEMVLYQEIGYDILDDFNDDLTFDDDDYRDGDIMEVYRECSFLDVDDNEPIWERDNSWKRPAEEERRKHDEELEEKRQREISEMRGREKSICIISQQFYGNRTGTEVKRENIDYFLRGHLGDYYPEQIKDVNRKMIKVPGSENVVIVYDQTQEDKYVNVEFPKTLAREGKEYFERWGEELKMHVSCEIPELGFKIHTRCFACRIDENGNLRSLEKDDWKCFIDYFPMK